MVSLNPPLICLEKRIAINIVKITRVDISWNMGVGRGGDLLGLVHGVKL
jgi:hypothetical protein